MDVEDGDQHCQGVPMSREEKVSNLKTALVHVARKMPKNAHSHFLLGLMYQRLGQPQKAVPAFERSCEILQQSEEEVQRPQLLSLVQIHYAQCILQASASENSDKELQPDELDDILSSLKESVKSDDRQAAVWNTLGLILLRTGRVQSAISVLSSLLTMVPDCLDSIANLGISYFQCGNLELSAKCFQDLILKDQNHPAAYINYAAVLLCKHGSSVAGAGATAIEGDPLNQAEAAQVAQECLTAAAISDPKSGPIWLNLANAYSLAGKHKSAKKCLEQAAKLDPQLSTRFAIALHRIKDAERSQDPSNQLLWAANEMASVLKEGDSTIIDLPTAWAGLALAHKVQHEISTVYETTQKDLAEAKEKALCSLKQAIEEDPDDGVSWHQLGLHDLCTLQFESSQKFLKAAIARCKDCSYAWSNLGVSLQMSKDPLSAEKVYKQALSLANTPQLAYAILSNLGNLYRQQKMFEPAKAILKKSLEVCSVYAPAHNNLGLVYVAEGQWEEARSCFQKATEVDPLLDAAKSNMIKAAMMCKNLPSQ